MLSTGQRLGAGREYESQVSFACCSAMTLGRCFSLEMWCFRGDYLLHALDIFAGEDMCACARPETVTGKSRSDVVNLCC